MEKLEKKVQKRANGLTAVALVGALAFGNSCAFNTYAKKENLWFTAATVGAVTDIVTTKYGIDKGYGEGNPIYGENPSIEKMILIKSAYLGLAYGLGKAHPEQRSLFYKIATIGGFLPAIFNLSRILFTSPEDN